MSNYTNISNSTNIYHWFCSSVCLWSNSNPCPTFFLVDSCVCHFCFVSWTTSNVKAEGVVVKSQYKISLNPRVGQLFCNSQKYFFFCLSVRYIHHLLWCCALDLNCPRLNQQPVMEFYKKPFEKIYPPKLHLEHITASRMLTASVIQLFQSTNLAVNMVSCLKSAPEYYSTSFDCYCRFLHCAYAQGFMANSHF